jgi:hypothetical protein
MEDASQRGSRGQVHNIRGCNSEVCYRDDNLRRSDSTVEARSFLRKLALSTTVLCAVKRRWSTAGESPVRELVRSAW